MNEIFWNIAGVIGFITAVVFIARFYKNHHVVDETPLEEIKMKIKIDLSSPTKERFETNSPPIQKQKPTPTPITKIRDPVYISFNSTNIIKDERLDFLGKSKKSGYPIYAIDKSNVGLLKGTKFTEILNLQKEL